MKRLTKKAYIYEKTIMYTPSEYAHYNKNKSKFIKCIKFQEILNRLGSFEDFMEENGFKNIQELQNALNKKELEKKKTE